MNCLLNFGTVIFCAFVIIYYLYEAETDPHSIQMRDAIMMAWACLRLLEVALTW